MMAGGPRARGAGHAYAELSALSLSCSSLRSVSFPPLIWRASANQASRPEEALSSACLFQLRAIACPHPEMRIV
jgi:hypothetical protein